MASRPHLAALVLAGCASGPRYAKTQISEHVFARPAGEVVAEVKRELMARHFRVEQSPGTYHLDAVAAGQADGAEHSGRRHGGMRGGRSGQGPSASTPSERYEVDGVAVDAGHAQVHIVRQIVTDDGIDSEEAVELEWKLIDALEPAQAAALVTR